MWASCHMGLEVKLCLLAGNLQSIKDLLYIHFSIGMKNLNVLLESLPEDGKMNVTSYINVSTVLW